MRPGGGAPPGRLHCSAPQLSRLRRILRAAAVIAARRRDSVGEPTIRDRAAISGIGETRYYKRGAAPVSEFALACEAVLHAVDDAGLDIEQIDGFASYSNDRNEPVRLAAALGIPELRYSGMAWGGGGGGICAAVANAAAAVAAGYANCVVVFRALAQGQFRRFGQGMRANVTT